MLLICAAFLLFIQTGHGFPTAPAQEETCAVQTVTLGLAEPSYDRSGGYSTYNCHVCPQSSCASQVHMIAMYEPQGIRRGFQQDPSVVPEVPVNVVAASQSTPLTFVFSTYEAANWVINVPEGVTVAHVFLMSYYLRYSSVKVVNGRGEELSDYRLHLPAQPYTRLNYEGTARGSSKKGIAEITRTMTSQYGCLTSFSGRYVAKSWTLDLSPLNTCNNEPVTTTPTTQAPHIEHVDCSTNPCENGARCTEAGAGPFHCFCSWPYYGQRCENENKADICDISASSVGMATPISSRNSGYSTHWCEVCPAQSCASEVHMIAMYEPEGRVRGFRENPSVIPDVEVDVLTRTSHLPLTLVFSSYEATNWVVKLPEGVTVAHVFLMSYYQSYSSVRVQNSNGVTLNNYELHTPTTGYTYMDHRGTGPPSTYSFGYGCSSCKGVDYVHSTMTSQYGCFTSFSGLYVAKSWILDLDNPDCPTRAISTHAPTSSTTRRPATTTTTEAAVIEHVDCSTNPCENGARCTEAGAGPFHCFCSWPYYGQRCENENKADICDISASSVGMATPISSRNSGYSTHWCEVCPAQSCASEVHMIAMYEPEGRVRGFRENPSVIPDVEVDVLTRTSHLPLTLVFSSYEATNWVLKLPEGVTVAHVFLMSYYQSYSSVRVQNSNGVTLNNYELHTPTTGYTYMDHRGTGPPSTYSFGYGCSSCKGVDYVHSTMTSQYGCFTSFSGLYVAKSWILDLDNPDCPTRAISTHAPTSSTTRRPATTTTTEAAVIEHVDCSTNPCENGARCTEAGAGHFHCFCSWPYYGQRCENENKADICDISTDAAAMATPTVSRNSGYSTHSCEVCPTPSCSSEVHVIAVYEPEGSVRGFQEDPSLVPDLQVDILSNSSHLPLTLVFSSYEATNWVVKLPEGVTVAHVFLISFYQSYSSVRVQSSSGTVLNNYELHTPSSRTYMDHRGTGPPSAYSFGYGCSSCKGVDYVTSTMTSQYGCFTSFSGQYVAKSWILDLDANNCE